jgi:microcystin degradation protein MlrC
MSAPRKLFFAAMVTESNSFSNIPTSRESFAPVSGAEALKSDGMLSGYLGHFMKGAAAIGAEVRVGTCAFAQPGAPVIQADYEALRDRLLDDLKREMPVDAVILLLHGAMVSERCLDCEGDILARARAIVGKEVPLVAVLDPHAHLTQSMVASADLLAFMKEYPHTDGPERLDHLLRVTQAMWQGRARPVPAVADCNIVGLWPTQMPPIRGFVDRLNALEERADILSISFVHGFPWGDTPDTGSRVLVYGNNDRAAAQRLADELAAEVWRMREVSQPNMTSIDAALDIVTAAREGPIVLADIADNAGGGAPADSSFILRAVLERGLQGVAFALMYDPVLVENCHQVGIGGTLQARVGGKLSRYSGQPVDLCVTVKGLARDSYQLAFGGRTRDPMGNTAWIHGRGVDIIVSSLRTQCFDPSAFSHIGLDPLARRALVVKSINHFQAGFAPIAKRILTVATPGALSMDFARLPYRVFTKPYWPRDELTSV